MLRPQIHHIDHIVVFVSDLARSRELYSLLLGNPVSDTGKLLKYSIGGIDLFFCLPNHRESLEVYDKDSVGVNHLALHVDHADLPSFAQWLSSHHVGHSGVRVDRHSGNDYIWLDDPDGMRIELFARNVC